MKRAELSENPFLQFEEWYREAKAADIRDPTAMSVATVSKHGKPSSRTVLLKSFDERGFVFFTNYESRKAREIAGNPFVSLLFLWHPIQKQISIEGRAERISQADSTQYFNSRPLGSRIGAWASPQSTPLESRSLLEEEFEKLSRRFSDGEVPLPSFWGGFRVTPTSFEFWQGREDRLHDRFYYQLQDNDRWRITRLAP